MTFSLLGMDIQTGERIQLSQSARRQGLYLIGSSGTGKSGVLVRLVLEDIKQGLGLCVLDPHGDLVDAVLKRLPGREEDVILLDSGDEEFPFGLNLLVCEKPQSQKAVQVVVEQTMHLFEQLFDLSMAPAHLSYALRNGMQTLMANPGSTLTEFPLLFTDERFRTRLLERVRDPNVRQFWQTFAAMTPVEQFERIGELLQKVAVFFDPLTVNIIGQSTTLDFRALMDQRKILLVKLDAQLPAMTSLLGTLVIDQLLTAAAARRDLETLKRKQFNLYLDEFHVLATTDIAKLMAEARKFGLATTIAHQLRSQLTSEIQAGAQAATNLMVFRVSGEDAQELKEQFASTPQPAEWRQQEKLAPSATAATWIVNGHPHRHPAVNTFLDHLHSATGTLNMPEDYEPNLFRTYENELNHLWHHVMTSPDPFAVLDQPTTIRLLLSILKYHDEYISHFHPIAAAAPRHLIDVASPRPKRPSPDFGAHYVLPFVRWPLKREEYVPQIEALLSPMLAAPDDQQFAQVAATYAAFVERVLTEHIESHLSSYAAAETEVKQALSQAVFDERLVPLKWREHREKGVYRPLYARELGTVAEEAARCQQIVQYWMAEERTHFEAFLKEVRACVLALHQKPILAGSGQYEMVPVGQLSPADVADLLASELTTLPDYTAKVRIKDVSSKRIVEYTVRTVEPERNNVVWGEALQQRMARIRAQNLRDGVVRPREEVEDEMRRRQDASLAEQPSLLSNAALQVSKGVHCEACGADNSESAKFCNQCGSKF
jgi:hypothetical protein